MNIFSLHQQSHLRNPITVIAITISLAVISLAAQDRGAQSRQYQPPPTPTAFDVVMPNIIVSPGEDYLIGASDIIEIRVEDAPEMSRLYRVSADGTIRMPVLGTVSARGVRADDLANALADRLRGEYLQDPQVSVFVRQINSRTYFIQGAVRRPGLYQIEGRPSLLKLITVAGGLVENFGSTAFIIHELKPNQKGDKNENDEEARFELRKANINNLLRGNFNQNVVIEPGAIVHIPPMDVFFVAGEVNLPGSFPLKEGTTLRQAISLAQGTSFQAAPSRAIIFREDLTSGKRQEIRVDVSAVMSGKKEDVSILANDIIIVPNSRMKSIGGTLLRAFGVNSARIPYGGYW